MSAFAFRLAAAVVRLWTRLYTVGLPPEMRERRREEIDADVWAFEHESNAGAYESLHVMARLAIGMPDDVGWRMERLTVRRFAVRSSIIFATAAIVAAVIANEMLRPPALPIVSPAPPLEILTLTKRALPAPPPRPPARP